MNAVERLRRWLQTHPILPFRVSDCSITVPPSAPTGFTLSLALAGEQFVVSFDGWHAHFTSEEEALQAFALGLTNECRLRVERRGRTECRWALERLTPAGWNEVSTVGLLLVPSWRKREVIYRQNAVLDSAVAATELG
jgi:hypothetical protein